MDKKAAEHVVKILKAIAHPVRLQIVEMLRAREMFVNDIVEVLDHKQAITSQQLNMMKNKGILSCRRDGVNVYYHIKDKNVASLLHCINDRCKRKRG